MPSTDNNRRQLNQWTDPFFLWNFLNFILSNRVGFEVAWRVSAVKFDTAAEEKKHAKEIYELQANVALPPPQNKGMETEYKHR